MVYAAITIEQKTMDGIPVFNHTSTPIHVFFEYLEEGKSIEEFLHDYPEVQKGAAQRVLQMAKFALTTERILADNFQGDE